MRKCTNMIELKYAQISKRSIYMNIGIFAQQHHCFHVANAQMCHFTVKQRCEYLCNCLLCICLLPNKITGKFTQHANVWARVVPQTTTIQFLEGICNTRWHMGWRETKVRDAE